MKNNQIITIGFLLLICIGKIQGQAVNWASLKTEERHMVNLNAGMEYSSAFGIGYGYHFKALKLPVIANTEFSVPSGDAVLDDFKSKTGLQIRWFEYRGIQLSTNIHGVFRRYENEFVRMVNFGSDLSGVAGYYRSKWFAAAEAGFDKAIVTHLKHSEAYRYQYEYAVDGWYEPAAGGNFYYGLQAGYSFGKHDITLRAGKVLSQDFETAPLVPWYGQMGYNFRF